MMDCPHCGDRLESESTSCTSPAGERLVTQEWLTALCPTCGDVSDDVDPEDVRIAEEEWALGI